MGTIRVSYYQYYVTAGPLVDESVIGEDADGLLSLIGPNGVAVQTGVHSGPVEVSVELLAGPPPPDEDQWSAISEVDLLSDGSGLFVLGWGHETVLGPPLPVPAGVLRLRVSARGREEGRERDTTTDIVETYLLQAWHAPALTAPLCVRRDGASDALGAGWTVGDWTAARALAGLGSELPDGPNVDMTLVVALPVPADVAESKLSVDPGWRDVSPLVDTAARLADAGFDAEAANERVAAVRHEIDGDGDGDGCRVVLGATASHSAGYYLAVLCRWWLIRIEQTVLDTSPEALLERRFREAQERSPYRPQEVARRPKLAHLAETLGAGYGIAVVDPDLMEALLDAPLERCAAAARWAAIWLADFSGIIELPFVPPAVEALASQAPLPPPFDDRMELWRTVDMRPHDNMVLAIDGETSAVPFLGAFDAILGAADLSTKEAAYEVLDRVIPSSGRAGYREVINGIRAVLGMESRQRWFGDPT